MFKSPSKTEPKAERTKPTDEDYSASKPSKKEATECPDGLRDQLAGAALQGLIVMHKPNTPAPQLAREAYVLADAMLAARE